MSKYLSKVYGFDCQLPNIKNLFNPDPGFVYVDIDLEQADAQVVAWESGCQRLKDIFHDPSKDFHSENAFAFYEGIKGIPVGRYEVDLGNGIIMVKAEDEWRKPLKGGAHATNYRTTPPTLAGALDCSIEEAKDFIDTWFRLNPEIKEWHQRTEEEVFGRGYIENKFGFRKRFLGRIDKNVLAVAQAWVPQSTVGNVINQGWSNIEREINKRPTFGPYFTRTNDLVRVAFQVHDSLVLQIRENSIKELLPDIRECMLVTVPYDDPLVIGLGNPEISKSSYGRVKPYSWVTGEPLNG